MSEKVIVKYGTHLYKGVTYVPGDVYPRLWKEIPKEHRFRFELKGAVEDFEKIDLDENDVSNDLEDIFVVKHRGGGKYNVLNTVTDKFVSDTLLSKKKAARLAEDLNG